LSVELTYLCTLHHSQWNPASKSRQRYLGHWCKHPGYRRSYPGQANIHQHLHSAAKKYFSVIYANHAQNFL